MISTLFKKHTVKEEIDRRKSTTARLLAYLREYGEINTVTLLQHFGTGCSSRIFELRREGHKIVTQYESPGKYRYIYLGQTENDE